VGLHTQLYFKARPAVDEPAYVMSVMREKVVVLVPRFGIEGTIWLKADVEGGRVSYDAEAHTVVVDRGAQGARVTVKVFEAVKVHISVQTAKADGKPSLKVLMTQPPLGDQPSDDPSALTGAVISKRKGREGEGGSGAEKKQKDKK